MTTTTINQRQERYTGTAEQAMKNALDEFRADYPDAEITNIRLNRINDDGADRRTEPNYEVNITATQ